MATLTATYPRQVPHEDDVELAHALLAEWNDGEGASKSELERRVWNDGSSHGRRFDRFIRENLGVPTTKRSKQTDRIADLERQVRGLGRAPVGSEPTLWEIQLQHARNSCVAALRTWNDPTATFRTGAFSLMFVAAWNSLAIALIDRGNGEWRKVDRAGAVKIKDGVEQSLDTVDLAALAFPGGERRGLRENIRFWLDLRNCVAHRHLPGLDTSVIAYAQAGLLNIEGVLADEFGPEYSLSETLSVPLQLSGFRDPGVLGLARGCRPLSPRRCRPSSAGSMTRARSSLLTPRSSCGSHSSLPSRHRVAIPTRSPTS
jgi:hypothetical protein